VVLFWHSRDVFSVKSVENRAEEDVRVLTQHRQGETQKPPAISNERVLAPAVRLEQVLVCLEKPSVNLNR
jgi:hypothetical protein